MIIIDNYYHFVVGIPIRNLDKGVHIKGLATKTTVPRLAPSRARRQNI